MTPSDGFDFQSLLNVGAGALMGLFGWLGKTLWDAVQELKNDIHKIEIDLPSNYVRKDEFAESFREIRDMLSKIWDKMDGKADR